MRHDRKQFLENTKLAAKSNLAAFFVEIVLVVLLFFILPLEESRISFFWPLDCLRVRGWIYLLAFSLASFPLSIFFVTFFGLIFSVVNKKYKNIPTVVLLSVVFCCLFYLGLLVLIILGSTIVGGICGL